MRHVVIVGGGASGLVAAISAARHGARVTLVEQKDRVGKKILSTGNGRCNLTNYAMESVCFRGDDLSLVEQILAKFGTKETMDFFESLGLLMHDRNGYVYPISDQASSVLDVLRMEVDRCNVQLILGESVKHITTQERRFCISTEKQTLTADAVVVATGGKAAKVLGSDGSGYTLAKDLGHHLSPVVPSLVQLVVSDKQMKCMAGVRTKAEVSLFVDDVCVAKDTGELQLTNYGISGIPVFQVSRYAAKALYYKQKVKANIDFMPQMKAEELDVYLNQRMDILGHRTCEEFVIGMLHKKVGEFLLKESGIDLHQCVRKVPQEKWDRFKQNCKKTCFLIGETQGFEQAQVCAGGVLTTEIQPNTMESVFVKGLYFAGEILDVDGICGGYNLQWAWSTGYIAGEHAAKG